MQASIAIRSDVDARLCTLLAGLLYDLTLADQPRSR